MLHHGNASDQSGVVAPILVTGAYESMRMWSGPIELLDLFYEQVLAAGIHEGVRPTENDDIPFRQSTKDVKL